MYAVSEKNGSLLHFQILVTATVLAQHQQILVRFISAGKNQFFATQEVQTD